MYLNCQVEMVLPHVLVSLWDRLRLSDNLMVNVAGGQREPSSCLIP